MSTAKDRCDYRRMTTREMVAEVDEALPNGNTVDWQELAIVLAERAEDGGLDHECVYVCARCGFDG